MRAARDRLLAIGGAEARAHRTTLDMAPSVRTIVHHLEAGEGPPVVLLHGASGGAANWYRLIAPLACRFRVLAPELPGFGLSPVREEVAPLGVAAADLLEAWWAAIGLGPAVVAGTSFGGLAALRFAQRSAARVAALVLIDSAGLGRRLPWAVRAAGLRPLASLLRRPSRAGIAFVLDHLVTAGPGSLPEEDRSALLEYLLEVERLGAAALLARTLPLFAGPRGQREVVGADELRCLAMPTLIVWGGRDRFLPVEHGRRAAAVIPDARCAVIPEAGHSPNWERPHELLDLMAPFLRSVHPV